MLWLALIHGANGMRTIVNDYVTHETTRRVLVQKGVANNDDFDHFELDAEASAERAARRNSLIERVMRIVIADAERAMREEQPYEELLAMVSAERAPA